ncbi:MAG: hypothetical protein KBI09_09860 [Mesotoga sp.]|nr:hypothetical protein [Mesotoga sp.]
MKQRKSQNRPILSPLLEDFKTMTFQTIRPELFNQFVHVKKLCGPNYEKIALTTTNLFCALADL